MEQTEAARQERPVERLVRAGFCPRGFGYELRVYHGEVRLKWGDGLYRPDKVIVDGINTDTFEIAVDDICRDIERSMREQRELFDVENSSGPIRQSV